MSTNHDCSWQRVSRPLDGSFRRVEVTLDKLPRGRGKLSVRTRTGYYAPRQSSGN